MGRSSQHLQNGFRLLVFIAALLPLAALIAQAVLGKLGANPVERLTHETGEWALRFIWLTLLMRPLKQWSGSSIWIKLRRMLGLYGFFYACLHFLIWSLADHQFDLNSMWRDVYERPYITVGFSALVLLLPLALTSTKAMIRRLGKNWKRLHQLIYAIAILVILHYLWLTKADYLEPAIYGFILALMLIWRLPLVQRGWLRFSQRQAHAH